MLDRTDAFALLIIGVTFYLGVISERMRCREKIEESNNAAKDELENIDMTPNDLGTMPCSSRPSDNLLG